MNGNECSGDNILSIPHVLIHQHWKLFVFQYLLNEANEGLLRTQLFADSWTPLTTEPVSLASSHTAHVTGPSSPSTPCSQKTWEQLKQIIQIIKSNKAWPQTGWEWLRALQLQNKGFIGYAQLRFLFLTF